MRWTIPSLEQRALARKAWVALFASSLAAACAIWSVDHFLNAPDLHGSMLFEGLAVISTLISVCCLLCGVDNLIKRSRFSKQHHAFEALPYSPSLQRGRELLMLLSPSSRKDHPNDCFRAVITILFEEGHRNVSLARLPGVGPDGNEIVLFDGSQILTAHGDRSLEVFAKDPSTVRGHYKLDPIHLNAQEYPGSWTSCGKVLLEQIRSVLLCEDLDKKTAPAPATARPAKRL